MTETAVPLPLDGIRVVDFTQVMLGPCCTQMLGDYGAEVIKIEKGTIGDLSRWSIGEDPDGLRNPVFCSLNRNKLSVTVDIRSPEGRGAVMRLIESADVVVNNFRPGVMDRLGFGFESLSMRNPRLIYAIGTGFGLSGPNVHKGGQDILAQAVSGVMQRKADPDLPLSIYPTALADYSAGMHLVQGVLFALLQRGKTGKGQQVSVSLYDSMLAMQMQEAAMWMMRGRDLNWAAMPLTGVFETTDGAIVLVGAFKPNPMRDICAALGFEDLSLEERFSTIEHQKENRAEIQTRMRRRFAENTTAHWLSKLEEQDLLCAEVKTLEAALDDPQTAANAMILETTGTAAGPTRLVGSPITMSQAPVSVRLDPPDLGADNAAIFGQLGLDPETLVPLEKQDAVA